MKSASGFTKHKYFMQTEYFLNCTSIAAGLGNFWRLPYTTYLHNGGSFLYQYFILYIVVALPMIVLNFGIGQFSGSATTELWRNLGPGWGGIGITQCLLAFVCLYCYGIHAAIALRYACNAWRRKFAWGICDEFTNLKHNCLPLYEDDRAKGQFEYTHNLSSSAESYLAMHLLHTDVHVEHVQLGPPNFELCFYLGLVWICFYLNTSTGVSKYTKLCFITGSLPYLLLFIFCIRVMLLPGAMQGISLLFTPTLEGFLSVDNWIGALMQCYFTLNITCGTITWISANMPRDHNLYKSVGIIMGGNALLAIMSSMTVFSVIGYLSQIQRLPFDEVFKTYKFWSSYISFSAGMVFINPAASLFAFLFFVGIFLSTLQENSSLLKILINNIHEWTSCRKSYVLTCLCLTCALLSSSLSTPEGTILATYIDLYGNLYVRAILVPLQIIVVCYAYGLKKWCWDFEFITKKPVNYYYRWLWTIFIPIILFLIYFGSEFSRAGTIYHLNLLPYNTRIACFIFLSLITLPIPIVLITQLIGNCGKGVKVSIQRTFNSEMWWPSTEPTSGTSLRFRAAKIRIEEIQKKKDLTSNVYSRFLRALFSKVP